MSEMGESCRVDVWLWRARFYKTRSLAARMVKEGCIRLARGGAEVGLDKPSRPVRPGDRLVLVRDERRFAVRVEALGERRGPAPEARALYSVVGDGAADTPASD